MQQVAEDIGIRQDVLSKLYHQRGGTSVPVLAQIAGHFGKPMEYLLDPSKDYSQMLAKLITETT